MKKLKIILQCNKLYYFIFIIALLYSFFYINYFAINSKYNIKDKKVTGIIINKKNTDGKLTFIVKGKEKIILNYYLKKSEKFNIEYKDKVVAYGKFVKPNNNSNFNLFNYKKYLYSKKIYYIFNANKIKIIKNRVCFFDILRRNIEKRIDKCNKTKEYLMTFILGDKSDIETNIKDSYQNLGISHLFAISGMHISFITLILLFVLKKVKIKYLIVNIFLILYLLIVNLSSSILRASIMFIFISTFKMFKIDIKSFCLMILLCSFFIFINPYIIYDIGFLFTFIISLAIIYFNKKIKEHNNYFIKLLYVSFLYFIFSLPIVINNFYQLNLLSIIINIIYIPIVTFIIFPFSILTFIFPFLDDTYYFFINIFESITKNISNIKTVLYFSKIPNVLCIIYYIFIIYYFKNITLKKTLLLLIIIFLFYNYNIMVFDPKINYIDVKQGDSTLIRLKNKNILIDTGGKVGFSQQQDHSIFKYNLFPYLKSEGIKKIDYLIITHGDFDHMGEAINLVNNFKVEKVIFNCGPYNDLEKELIKVLDKKKIKYYSCIKELNIDKNKLYFLQTKEYDNENDNSNVIYTDLNGYKFMFMGDASTTTEKEILKEYNLSDIDVLKVGHHGSKTSSSIEFINEINPKYSVISVGKNNRYGHPNKEVLENLEQSKIYRTDQDGSIMFSIKNNKLEIETCSP